MAPLGTVVALALSSRWNLPLDPVVPGRPLMSEYLLRVRLKVVISFNFNTIWKSSVIRSIKEKPRTSPIEVDLTGPQGNAYYLLGLASNLSRQLRYDTHRTELILDEMKLSDYEGLLHTFDREFGLLVTLWR